MKNIFVEGKPLEEFLGIIKDEETKNEFNETVAGIEKTLWKPTVPSKPKPFYVAHSRARKLTDTQIRKEYGIMQKPFDSLTEHLLYLLEVDGPQRSKDLIKKTGKSSGHISGTLQRLHERIPETIYKTADNKWMLWDSNAEGALKLYNEQKNKRKEKVLKIKMPDPAYTTPKEERDKALEEIQKITLPKAIKEAVEKELNLKITIEGTIKILFGFNKE